MSNDELLHWIQENAMEIINRNGKFTTITVQTKRGPRAFRCAGTETTLLSAVKKAKEYIENEPELEEENE